MFRLYACGCFCAGERVPDTCPSHGAEPIDAGTVEDCDCGECGSTILEAIDSPLEDLAELTAFDSQNKKLHEWVFEPTEVITKERFITMAFASSALALFNAN